MGDDGVDDGTPGEKGGDGFVAPDRHEAADRFATRSLRAADRIGRVLAETGDDDGGAVVLDRSGRRPTLAGLDRLITATLDEQDEADDSHVSEDTDGSDGAGPE